METYNNTRFISFEGIDFSGKTTQINLLEAYLTGRGFHVYQVREPGGTQISERIRDLLLDKTHLHMNERCEIFLYSAARSQLVTEKILPLLDKGYFVIADRFVDSTTAYQGYGRNLDLEMVQQINRAATLNLLPGTTFYLELDPEAAEQRRQISGRETDRLEQAGLDFFKRVYNGYKKIAEQNKGRIVLLNAADSVAAIHERIIKIIESKITG